MNKRAPWIAVALLAAAALSAALTAQAPPPASQSAAPPQAVYRSGIDLVTTDAIPRDKAGQFVSDLKPSDFEVFEDGVKQDIVQLFLFHGGRQYSPLAAPVQVQREGIVLPPSRPTNDAAGRIFIFFLDDLHLDFRNTGRIRDLIKKIRTTLVHDGDLFGVVSTGPVVNRHRPDVRPEAARRGREEDLGRRPAAAGDHRERQPVAGRSERGAVSGAHRVLDGVRPDGAAGEGPQPAEGAHLHQQRLRFQSVPGLALQGGPAAGGDHAAGGEGRRQRRVVPQPAGRSVGPVHADRPGVRGGRPRPRTRRVDAHGEPGERHHLHARPSRPGRHARPGRQHQHGRVAGLAEEVAGQHAGPGR